MGLDHMEHNINAIVYGDYGDYGLNKDEFAAQKGKAVEPGDLENEGLKAQPEPEVETGSEVGTEPEVESEPEVENEPEEPVETTEPQTTTHESTSTELDTTSSSTSSTEEPQAEPEKLPEDEEVDLEMSKEDIDQFQRVFEDDQDEESELQKPEKKEPEEDDSRYNELKDNADRKELNFDFSTILENLSSN